MWLLRNSLFYFAILLLTSEVSFGLVGLSAFQTGHSDILKNYNRFVKQGVPEEALTRSLEVFYQAFGRHLKLKADSESHVLRYKNDKYMVIIDYSKPSTEKRFYLLNLSKGSVEKHYVAHGIKTGGVHAYRFSNIVDSLQTSLGFYITGSQYVGKFGPSLKLYGLDDSNDNAYARYIVIHGAWYVSPEFIKEKGRLGLSHGCPALEKSVAKRLIPLLQSGTLVYAYHKDLSDRALKDPLYQSLRDDNPPEDEPDYMHGELEQLPY